MHHSCSLSTFWMSGESRWINQCWKQWWCGPKFTQLRICSGFCGLLTSFSDSYRVSALTSGDSNGLRLLRNSRKGSWVLQSSTILILHSYLWLEWKHHSSPVQIPWFLCQTPTVCAQATTTRQLPSGPFEPFPIPCWPWSYITFGFITDLPSLKGHTTILNIIDRFSKTWWNHI